MDRRHRLPNVIRLQAGTPEHGVLFVRGHRELKTVGVSPKDGCSCRGEGQNPGNRVGAAKVRPDAEGEGWDLDVGRPVFDRLFEAPPQPTQLDWDRARDRHAIGDPDLGRRSTRQRINPWRQIAGTTGHGSENKQRQSSRSDSSHVDRAYRRGHARHGAPLCQGGRRESLGSLLSALRGGDRHLPGRLLLPHRCLGDAGADSARARRRMGGAGDVEVPPRGDPRVGDPHVREPQACISAHVGCRTAENFVDLLRTLQLSCSASATMMPSGPRT